MFLRVVLCSEAAILYTKYQFLLDSSSVPFIPDPASSIAVLQIDSFSHNPFLLRCVISQKFALFPFGSFGDEHNTLNSRKGQRTDQK